MLIVYPVFLPYCLLKKPNCFFSFFLRLSGKITGLEKGASLPDQGPCRSKLSLEIPVSSASNWPEQLLLSHCREAVRFRPTRHTGKSSGELLERFSKMKRDRTGRKSVIMDVIGQLANLNVDCLR